MSRYRIRMTQGPQPLDRLRDGLSQEALLLAQGEVEQACVLGDCAGAAHQTGGLGAARQAGDLGDSRRLSFPPCLRLRLEQEVLRVR